MRKAIISLTLSALLMQPAFGQVQAIPMPGDTRLVTFPYDPNNTYNLLTRPKSVTNVQFSGDETIRSVALGDTVQWEVAKTGDGKHLFIKPKFENINTSATIVTDKRTYQIMLYSSTEKGKWYQRVTWEYPDLLVFEEQQKAEKAAREDEEQARLKSQSMGANIPLDRVNFDYSINGEAAFKPNNVFDDGSFTYLRMPANLQELPALFLTSKDNEAELINYVVRGEYLIVQRLIDRALLKIGKNEVRVTNNKTVKRSLFE